jgi:hypothetical protein
LQSCLTGINHKNFSWRGEIHHSIVSHTLLEGNLTSRPYDAVVDMTRFQLHGEEYSSKRLQFFSYARNSLHYVHYWLQKSLPLVPNLSKMTMLQTTDKSPNFQLTIHIYYPTDKSLKNITWHKIESGTCIMHCHSSITHHFMSYK